MYLGRWIVVLWAVLSLSLWHPGMSGTGRAQAQEADNVNFLWAFEALVAEGKVTKQVPIREDMTLKTGDQLKMFVELRKPCFVYVVHHGAQGEVQLLFPYNTQQFTADYQPAKLYEIPPADGWFRLNEQAGRETFYLMASAQRLLDLEKLLDTYATAKPAEQPQVASTLLAELRNLIKQHRSSVQPGRPVPIAGNMRRGVEGLEISASNFYSKTFTIEHR
jgi:Domain of unknown function (DUF4384)